MPSDGTVYSDAKWWNCWFAGEWGNQWCYMGIEGGYAAISWLPPWGEGGSLGSGSDRPQIKQV